jgi:hypothetical protein
MIKLLMTSLYEYCTKELKRYRASDEEYSVVIYEVTNKVDVTFTRIDIYRVMKK